MNKRQTTQYLTESVRQVTDLGTKTPWLFILVTEMRLPLPDASNTISNTTESIGICAELESLLAKAEMGRLDVVFSPSETRRKAFFPKPYYAIINL